MNVGLTRSCSRQQRKPTKMKVLNNDNNNNFNKSKSNANLFSKTTDLNVVTTKEVNNTNKQDKAKRRNRYQIEYESEYQKQYSKPRIIPQVVRQQYISYHFVDTNRILFPDDEYDNDKQIFSTTMKGKKRSKRGDSSGSIVELFTKGGESKNRKKISGKLNEETGIFSAQFRKLAIKNEKKKVDLVQIKKDQNYAGNCQSAYGLWHKLSTKAKNIINDKIIKKGLNGSDYTKIKLKSTESDLFGTHTALPKRKQGKFCNYINKSSVF